MTRTYNPVTRRYEDDPKKDYSKPSPIGVKALTAHVLRLEAKLEAIAKCTNVKAVKVILKG